MLHSYYQSRRLLLFPDQVACLDVKSACTLVASSPTLHSLNFRTVSTLRPLSCPISGLQDFDSELAPTVGSRFLQDVFLGNGVSGSRDVRQYRSARNWDNPRSDQMNSHGAARYSAGTSRGVRTVRTGLRISSWIRITSSQRETTGLRPPFSSS